MCQPDPNQLETLVRQAVAETGTPLITITPPAQGSRRRRLWELDLQHFESLIDENAVLARELGAAQQRATRQADEQRQRSELQQTQIVQLRAQLIGRDTALALLREDLQTLEAAAPGLKSRFELAREGERQVERVHQLERALLQAQQEAERQRRRAEELAAELQRRDSRLAAGLKRALLALVPATEAPTP
jgi:DNA repair exonuclease SbcCD ATPase subunit